MRLNLPDYGPRLAKKDGKPVIFDEVRRKFVALTPEEWVRQHFLHFLLASGYPRGLFSVESGLKYNRLQKRTDLLCYDRQALPYLLIECKAPDIELDTQTFEQIAVYNKVIGAPHLCLTNGMRHLYYRLAQDEQGANSYTPLPNLPPPPQS